MLCVLSRLLLPMPSTSRVVLPCCCRVGRVTAAGPPPHTTRPLHAPHSCTRRALQREPKAPAKEIRPAKSAVAFYRAEHRDRVVGANPDVDIGTVIQILVDEYNALSEEEQAPYVEKEAADQV